MIQTQNVVLLLCVLFNPEFVLYGHMSATNTFCTCKLIYLFILVVMVVVIIIMVVMK